jgi:hypothetical protein
LDAYNRQKTGISNVHLARSQPVHKAALRICEPHFAHKGAEVWEPARLNINEYTTSPGLRSTRRGAYKMREALEINFALWGMMLCAAVQVAQRFEVY